jgi:hypothetical protein
MFDPTVGSLQKLNPLVWRRSQKPVITGINRVLINAKYDSPCVAFLETTFVPYRNKDLKDWCDRQFKTDFIEPLRKFCKSPYHMPNAEVVLSRQKRLALLAIGLIAVFSVAVTTTVGV